MLHLFLISNVLVVVLANPFHKYPFVFLLDVGNEEIGKLNTEQIRLSIPGGSLAMRYPAVGDGDTIGHVRVSGIDFGTDLKASIIQGGPGYRYAVFVFMGNPGVPYDAVVTIQTIPSEENSASKYTTSVDNENYDFQQGSEDSNDSAEDMSDNVVTKTELSGNTKSQVMQSSSNIYQYASNDAVDDGDFKNVVELQNDENFQDIKAESDNEEGDGYNDEIKNQIADDHAKGDYSEDSSDDDVRVVNVNRNQYGTYEAFKPHWFGGVRFYPQAALYVQDGYAKSIYGTEDDDDDDKKEGLNEVNAVNSFKDANNNINFEYGSAVEN